MSEPPVEVAVGWWLPSEAATAWPDQGGPEDEADLIRLLQVAYELCLEYQEPPVDEDGDPLPVPERFREAQLLQARAQWTFERTGGGDMIGPDGTQVRVYPMGWQVKNLLRPDDGVPVIG
ncbi:hypothetical protein [Cellulosimicrobium sp. 22601]|uniref:hypothetical protein n=1 Tax=unclassified Cellulosimicrobium TaxID=2624466 RepID=UPI003F853C0B